MQLTTHISWCANIIASYWKMCSKNYKPLCSVLKESWSKYTVMCQQPRKTCDTHIWVIYQNYKFVNFTGCNALTCVPSLKEIETREGCFYACFKNISNLVWRRKRRKRQRKSDDFSYLANCQSNFFEVVYM